MIERYIKKLLKQYQDILGNMKFKLDSDANKEEFYHYITEQLYHQLELYRIFLQYHGIFDSSNTNIEIGKGKFDTASSKKTPKLVLVTSFAKTFDDKDRNIFQGNVKIENIRGNNLLVDLGHGHNITIYDLNYFMNHNPYDYLDILDLIKIAEKGNNVCLGVTGNIHDVDKSRKIEKLSMFAEKTDGVVDFNRVKDTYLGISYTKPKIKKKHM